jgi:cell division septation protein DedD
MERRRYPRIAVNLNVALLDNRAMPRGCRVRDVSQSGMLLQFEHPVSSGTFETGNAVKVRVSLREGEDRTVLLLPATVRRAEDKGLGVEFDKPAAELMQLVEPYQLDKPKTVEAAVTATAAAGQGAAGGAHTLAAELPSRPRYRRTPDTRARLAGRIAAIRESLGRSGEPSPERPAQAAAARPGDRRVLQVGLVSLAVAVAIVVFDLATTSSTSRRLSALEQATNLQAETLAGLQIRLSADRHQENQVTQLSTRINELAVAVAALETGRLAPAGREVTAGTLPTNQSRPPDSAEEERPLQISPGEAATASAAPDASGGGPWVLNLVSLFDRAAADRFADKARSAGIPVEQNQATVKGKQVWRVQVSGFASREAASHYGDINKNKLGVRNVWIFKR